MRNKTKTWRLKTDIINLSLSRLLGLIAFMALFTCIIFLIVKGDIMSAAQFSSGLFVGTWGIKLAGNKLKSGE